VWQVDALMVLNDPAHDGAADKVCSNRVFEACVMCTPINHVGKPELAQPSKPLELGRINYLDSEWTEHLRAVQRILIKLMLSLHFLTPSIHSQCLILQDPLEMFVGVGRLFASLA
jgi:hypothetical protein